MHQGLRANSRRYRQAPVLPAIDQEQFGLGGGYRLDKDADRISIADIVCAVDHWVEYRQVGTRRTSEYAVQTTVRRIWTDLSRQNFYLTANIILLDLAKAGELG